MRSAVPSVIALVAAISCTGVGIGDQTDAGDDLRGDTGSAVQADATLDAGSSSDVDAGTGADAGANPNRDAGTDSGAATDRHVGDDAIQDRGSDDGGSGDDGSGDDGGGSDDGGSGDGDAAVDAAADVGPALPRGLRWVRENPMFISALAVQMGPPPPEVVNEYFDDFHASAVHLWENGVPTEIFGWAAAGHPRFRFLSWLHKDGTSLDGGEVAGDLPPGTAGLVGYQIGDEPGTWGHFEEIVAGLATVRAHDPGALLVLNFTYQLEDQLPAALEHFGAQTDGDVYSYDCYTWNNGTYEHLARYREAGLLHHKPYWRYLYGYQQEAGDPIHATDLRWEAFVGLTFGFTGHTWFLYQVATAHGLIPALYEVAGDYAAAKTTLWGVVAQINLELAVLGRAVTQLTSTDVRYVPTLELYWPRWIDKWEPGAGSDPYMVALDKASGELGLEILAGFFVDDSGELYAMIQNARHEHAGIPINRSDPGTIAIDFDFSAAPPELDRTRVQRLNQRTGQVEDVPLTSATAAGGALEVILPAGDVFFFKYATGRPFALQPSP